MNISTAIRERFSYRGMYSQTPVPREHLMQIMEAGLAAPSGCNKQTTCLIAIDDPDVLAPLAALLQKPHFASAPAAIVVLTEAIVAYEGACFNVQDYAAAIQNMLLEVVQLGYASCWIEGYITHHEGRAQKMADILGVPKPLEVVAYLPIGTPLSEGVRARKRPFAERAWFNQYKK